jgi:hypothetical protein
MNYDLEGGNRGLFEGIKKHCLGATEEHTWSITTFRTGKSYLHHCDTRVKI